MLRLVGILHCLGNFYFWFTSMVLLAAGLSPKYRTIFVDCMLVPSMENGGVLQKPLCVHWLNNKELVFSIGAEKLLTEILQSESDLNRRSFYVLIGFRIYWL